VNLQLNKDPDDEHFDKLSAGCALQQAIIVVLQLAKKDSKHSRFFLSAFSGSIFPNFRLSFTEN
jgi:hypothetical protein